MNLEPRRHPQGETSVWVAVVFAILSVLALTADLLEVIHNEVTRSAPTTQATTLRTNIVVPGPLPPCA